MAKNREGFWAGNYRENKELSYNQQRRVPGLIVSLIFLLAFFCLSGCRDNPYSDGYKDGWEGSFQRNTDVKYVKGYVEGKRNSELYYLGYHDGRTDKPAIEKYRNNNFYKTGYADAKVGKLPAVKKISI